MPIYMDLHILPGVKARDVAEAHRRDMLIQNEHGCNCMTYWIDEKRGNVFCLIEAPDKEAVETMHNRAHGLIPHRIIEVNPGVVESFLGRISDPEEAKVSDEGLKIFSDPSFRILMLTLIDDLVLLQHHLGMEKTGELITLHNDIIRKNIALHGGREAEWESNGFVVAFSSAAKAVSCALAIQKNFTEAALVVPGFRIGINAGEPVTDNATLFGDAILLAQRLCAIARGSQIAIASAVRELVTKDHFQTRGNGMLSLSAFDETLLENLFNRLEENWQDADFDITDYCQSMAMSKSQLYRKTILLTGLSPNLLLKEFRLQKAKDLMKKQHYSISQITFESGFTSPSYFTKCFKKKYGLLPMAYLELLH